MKKVALVLLTVLCLVSVLAITVGAAPDTTVTRWEVDGQEYVLPGLIASMLDSFLSIIPALHGFITTYLGGFAIAAYIILALLLLAVATVGYRFLTAMRVVLGAVAGLLLGHITWNIIASTVGIPVSIMNAGAVIRWIVLVVFALLGVVFTLLLRRVGAALSVAFIASICILPCIRHTFLLIAVFALVLTIAILKNRESVILITSLGLSVFVMYMLFGANGMFPLNTAMYISTAVDPILLMGLFLGAACSVVHFYTSRKVRA